MLAKGTNLIVPEQIPGDGAEASGVLRAVSAGKEWWPRSGTPPISRATDRRSWIKDKNWFTQEIVIGGWRQGEGGRSSGIGALLMGIPGAGGLDFVGRVGTGFTEKELAMLKRTLAPLHTDESPFNVRLTGNDAKDITFVRPELVGEVRYGEWTSDGHLRHPSWRGLRPDKSPAEVVRE